MRLVSLIVLLAAAAILPKSAQGSTSCIRGYGLRGPTRFEYLTMYENAELNVPNDLPVSAACPLAGGTNTMYRWFTFVTPGDSTMSFDMIAKDFATDNPSTVAIFSGDCDALTCAATASSGVGEASWTAVGGTKYRILVTKPKTSDTDVSLRAFEFQGATPMTICQMELALKQPSLHKESCTCNEEVAGTATMECEDRCANCHETEDGSTYCYFPSLVNYYDTTATTGPTGDEKCYVLADGFDTTIEGSLVCVNTPSYELRTCEMSAEDVQCSSCFQGQDITCSIGVNRNTEFPVAQCGAGGIFDPCGNTGLTGAFAGYEQVVNLRTRNGEIPAVGDCVNDEGELVESIAPNTIGMSMDTFTSPLTLVAGESVYYRLPVDSTIHKYIQCAMTADSGDPDLRVTQNSVTGRGVCSDGRIGTDASCPMMMWDDVISLYLEVKAHGTNTAENISIFCTPFDKWIYLNSDSGPFDLQAGTDSYWLFLDVRGREAGSTLSCSLEGSNGDPDMTLVFDRKDAFVSCISTSLDAKEECEVEMFGTEQSLFVLVRRGFGDETFENIKVRCEPVYDGADEILVLGRTSPPFNVANGPKTFAMEMSGETAFCDLNHVDGADFDFTDIDFFIEIGTPPDIVNRAATCVSGDFFSDDEVCFAAGGILGQTNVVYTTVVSQSGVDTTFDLTCTSPGYLFANKTSWDFNLDEDEFRPFIFEVPHESEGIVCNSEANEGGDVDLWIKVGLGSPGFDCVSNEFTSSESCGASVETTTFGEDRETVFVLAYGYNATNGVTVTCSTASADEVVAASRSSLDSGTRKLSNKKHAEKYVAQYIRSNK